MRREVAVIPHSPDKYSVMCREKSRFWPWFGRWRLVIFIREQRAWTYPEARELADQVLRNGVVPGDYASHCHPVIDKDTEVES